MKTKNSVWGIMLFLVLPVLFLAGCKEDPIIVDQETKITGKAHLEPGTPGDLSNAMVSIYVSQDDWNTYNPVLLADVTGTGAKINFVFSDVVPGNYYLDIWVDNDLSDDWSLGDFVGWYGSGNKNAPALSPFMVAENKTKNMGDIECVIF